MARTLEEVDADIAASKAKGEHPWCAARKALRAERDAIVGVESKDADPEKSPGEPAPFCASDDTEFVNECLAQLLLRGKGLAGRAEQNYSDIRSLLQAKHLIEDVAGLAPTHRLVLPPWDTLGRERDTGEKFKPGENQTIADGLAQRAVPARTAPAKPSFTTADGQPLRLPRLKLDEPEGNASFVTSEADAE